MNRRGRQGVVCVSRGYLCALLRHGDGILSYEPTRGRAGGSCPARRQGRDSPILALRQCSFGSFSESVCLRDCSSYRKDFSCVTLTGASMSQPRTRQCIPESSRRQEAVAASRQQAGHNRGLTTALGGQKNAPTARAVPHHPPSLRELLLETCWF